MTAVNKMQMWQRANGKLLIFILMLIGFNASSQNLVINPSFEDSDIFDVPSVPGVYTIGADAKNWSRNYSYYNKHHPIEIMQTPIMNDSIKGTPFGDGCISFKPYAFNDVNVADCYLEGRLLDSLIIGHKYKLSFYYCCSGETALVLNMLDAYFGNGNFFELCGRERLPYPTITFKLINNGNWNKAEGVFIAKNNSSQIAFGIFKHDDFPYGKSYLQYHKSQYKVKQTLEYFTENKFLFCPKPFNANVKEIPFYMDSIGSVKLYDSYIEKNKQQHLGKCLVFDKNIWPEYFIDNIELVDITYGE